MAQVINTNIFSINSQRALMNSQASMQTSLQRLSSGLRINSAKDDAAGLAISERMTSQIRGLGQAMRNANDGISMLQTAEGALDEVGNMLQRMRELSVQSANDTLSSNDRTSLNTEYQALKDEINRIKDSAEFNNTQLLDGTASSITLQVSASGGGAGSTINVAMADISSLMTTPGDITSKANAVTAMTFTENAIDTITSERGKLGAVQNRLESTVRNLANVIENQSAARSRIRDADFASETANLTRTQILQQAGSAMLAQANALPQNVLSLLR